MKANLMWTSVVLLSLVGCSGGNSGSGETGVVDVEQAISAPRQLKLSDLGSDVRFVRLETTDSSLIGGQWKAVVFGDKIVIGNNLSIMTGGEKLGRAMVFDLNTGKFLNFVGSQGQGPGEYFSPNPLGINPANGEVYFSSSSYKGWVVYGIDGSFKRTFLPELEHTSNTLFLSDVTERGPVMKKDLEGPTRAVAIYNYSSEGQPLDSMVILDGKPGPERGLPDFDGSVTFWSHKTPLGDDFIEVVNGDNHFALRPSSLYPVGSTMHYHEFMGDTIYDIADGGKPALIFNLGSDFKPVEKIKDEWFTGNDLIITDVLETPSKMVFGLSRGWLGDDDHTEFIGVYGHDTRTTVMGNAKDAFADDITGFMPVVPRQVLPDGTLAGWLTMEQIADWLDEHPDASRPDWLSDFDPEDNPVLVLIK